MPQLRVGLESICMYTKMSTKRTSHTKKEYLLLWAEGSKAMYVVKQALEGRTTASTTITGLA